MFKFPLKKPIILFLEGNIEFQCTVQYAGTDTLRCIDAKRLIYEKDQTYYTLPYDNEIIFDRSKIIGYTNILDNTPTNTIKFKIIK